MHGKGQLNITGHIGQFPVTSQYNFTKYTENWENHEVLVCWEFSIKS